MPVPQMPSVTIFTIVGYITGSMRVWAAVQPQAVCVCMQLQQLCTQLCAFTCGGGYPPGCCWGGYPLGSWYPCKQEIAATVALVSSRASWSFWPADRSALSCGTPAGCSSCSHWVCCPGVESGCLQPYSLATQGAFWWRCCYTLVHVNALCCVFKRSWGSIMTAAALHTTAATAQGHQTFTQHKGDVHTAHLLGWIASLRGWVCPLGWRVCPCLGW
jgi:hypothetical protein